MAYLDAGFIDCHTHLTDSMFEEDLEQVLENARSCGVAAALVCSITVNDFDKVLTLSEKHPDLLAPCLGIHPVQKDLEGNMFCVRQSDIENAISRIEQNVDKIVAIGEIGLDFQPRITPTTELKDVQRHVLKAQVDLALKHDLPVNVHSRSAGKPTIAALKEYNARNVLLHAFDGRPSVAMEGVKEGYFFSIPPSIVRSDQLKLVKQLPMDNIVLETDCPGLGPVKGERNEPANIKVGCEYISQVKNIDIMTVKRITTENAVKLFPKLKQVLKIT